MYLFITEMIFETFLYVKFCKKFIKRNIRIGQHPLNEGPSSTL